MSSPLPYLLGLLALAACRSNDVLADQTSLESPWSEAFDAPRLIRTERVRLEPLAMAFWVTEDQLAKDLDEHLVSTVLERIERGWPVDKVFLALPSAPPRGAQVLRKLGLDEIEGGDRLVFA